MKKKRNALVRVCLWSFIAMVLIAGLFSAMGGSSRALSLDIFTQRGSNRQAYAEDMGSYTVPAVGIQSISVEWVSGTVDVNVHSGNDIYFSESSGSALKEDDLLHYTVKGGKLSISFTAPRKGILSWFQSTPSKSLTLNLPASLVLEKLALENVSSTLTFNGAGLSIEKLDIENVSGKITVQNATADKFELESVSGSIDIHGSFSSVQSENVSGKQIFRLSTTPDTMKVEVVSGDITVYLPKDKGFTATLDSVSGGMKSDFADVQGKNARFGDGAAKLSFESVSGGVSILYDGPQPVEKPEAAKPTPVPAPTSNGEPVSGGSRNF